MFGFHLENSLSNFTYYFSVISNINGEYSTTLIEGEPILSVAVHPIEGKIFWIRGESENESYLESSGMDGSARQTLVPNLPYESRGLVVDIESNRLYWISGQEVMYSNLDGTNVVKLNLPSNLSVTAITVYKGKVYYADQTDQSIYVADKTLGENSTITSLRNGTSGVLALRIYDAKDQTGTHPCQSNNGGCQHLCLPRSKLSYTCKCATGKCYYFDFLDIMFCVHYFEN